jgi:hypothetical protein
MDKCRLSVMSFQGLRKVMRGEAPEPRKKHPKSTPDIVSDCKGSKRRSRPVVMVVKRRVVSYTKGRRVQHARQGLEMRLRARHGQRESFHIFEENQEATSAYISMASN